MFDLQGETGWRWDFLFFLQDFGFSRCIYYSTFQPLPHPIWSTSCCAHKVYGGNCLFINTVDLQLLVCYILWLLSEGTHHLTQWLCFYCGQKNHQHDNYSFCPPRPENFTAPSRWEWAEPLGLDTFFHRWYVAVAVTLGYETSHKSWKEFSWVLPCQKSLNYTPLAPGTPTSHLGQWHAYFSLVNSYWTILAQVRVLHNIKISFLVLHHSRTIPIGLFWQYSLAIDLSSSLIYLWDGSSCFQSLASYLNTRLLQIIFLSRELKAFRNIGVTSINLLNLDIIKYLAWVLLNLRMLVTSLSAK